MVEIIPPAVDTDLGGVGLHTFGVPLKEFSAGVRAQLQTEAMEITYGFSEKTSQASRQELNATFERMNSSP